MTEKPIPIRFSSELVARFDKIVEALSEKSPGMRVTRSDAVRMAAERGAAELETELGLNKRPKRK